MGNDIEIKCNNAVANGVLIDGEWLQQQIDNGNGKGKIDESDTLINHFQTYIDNLPYKRKRKKKKPVTTANINKYKSIQNKIIAFEKHRKKKIFVKDVNLAFRTEFINYLSTVEKLSDNTIGRYITFIKTVCLDAKIYEIETHPQLEAFKGFTNEASKIHFTFDELEKIERAKIVSDALLNARDWLLYRSTCFRPVDINKRQYRL